LWSSLRASAHRNSDIFTKYSHQCKESLTSVNGLCEGDGECGTDPSLNQCTSGYEIYRRVECTSPPKLTFHTCNVNHGDTNEAIYYQADGGKVVALDNVGDDREKNKYDVYDVPPASNTISIIIEGSDAWCIDKITYGSLTVDLSNQQKYGVWLDKPCSGSNYDRPCTKKITIDVKTGKVEQNHEQGGIVSLDLPYLKVHTCNVNNAGTNDPIYYSASPTFSTSSHLSLDTYDHNDREKNKIDTYYSLKPASNAFNLAAPKGDGWCVDSIEYVWASQNIHTKAKLNCPGKSTGVWLDGPCSETSYGGVPCAQQISVGVTDGAVNMMGIKGMSSSTTKALCA